ncbi:MAG: glycosyltransferase family A protein [Terracidiphilus sp.]|jgi:hypothetical protein
MIDLNLMPQVPASPNPVSFGWTLVAAVNDEQVLHKTLLTSPAFAGRCQWIAKRGFRSAGEAYNSALDEAEHDIVVFAHQDTFLPATWLPNLAHSIQQLTDIDAQWAVLGSFGVTQSRPPDMRGFCYSTGLRRTLGAPFAEPVPAQSLDEFVLIVRKSSGIRFDEQLPGFHLYGTDICLQAEAQNLGAYIVSAFCIHNANGIVRLPRAFWSAYLYLRHKWWNRLPITTCCTTLTKGCLPIARRLAVELKHSVRSRSAGQRSTNVAALCERLAHSDPCILNATGSSSTKLMNPIELPEEANSIFMQGTSQ